MSANRTVTATFTPITGGPFTLTTSVTGQGNVTRSPNQASYPAGTVVTLTANAGPGFRFDNWSGDLAGTANPTTITMNANRNVTANFAQVTGGLDFALYGFAATGQGTTGGAGGATVTSTRLDQLRTACRPGRVRLVIRVVGTITGNEAIRVESNKSILGAPGSAAGRHRLHASGGAARSARSAT